MANIIPFARTDAASPAKNAQTSIVDPGAAGDPQDGVRWAQLMVQAQDGDRVAYHALLKSLAPYVRAIARRYLGRHEDAEDAVQDVLMIVHGIRHTYERGRPFKPWLSTIASRRCIDLLRRRAHRVKHQLEAEFDAEGFPQAMRTPEEIIESEQAAGTLRRAVADLPERQREAVRLLRMNELSLDEAADRTRQSAGALKVACHRAMRSLQRTLALKRDTHD